MNNPPLLHSRLRASDPLFLKAVLAAPSAKKPSVAPPTAKAAKPAPTPEPSATPAPEPSSSNAAATEPTTTPAPKSGGFFSSLFGKKPAQPQPAAPQPQPAPEQPVPSEQPTEGAGSRQTTPTPAPEPSSPNAPQPTPAQQPATAAPQPPAGGFLSRLFKRAPNAPPPPSTATTTSAPAQPKTPSPDQPEEKPVSPHATVSPAALAKLSLHIHKPEFKNWFGDWENEPHNASKVIDIKTGEPQETHALPHEVTAPGSGAKGLPITVYHGTPHGTFHVFDKSKIANPEEQLFGPGFYFTTDPNVAEVFAAGGHSGMASGHNPVVMPYYLNIRKPFNIDFNWINPLKLPPEERKILRNAHVQRIFASEGRSAAIEAGHEFDAGRVGFRYKEAVSDRGTGGLGVSKAAIQKMLQEEGYDGMTVKAPEVKDETGKYGEEGSNQYWIAFEPSQIKSVHNEGTFDPHNPHVLKALETLPAPQAIALASRLTRVPNIRTRAAAIAAYEKANPSQRSLFDEEEHPRETTAHDGKKPGEFAPKGVGSTNAEAYNTGGESTPAEGAKMETKELSAYAKELLERATKFRDHNNSYSFTSVSGIGPQGGAQSGGQRDVESARELIEAGLAEWVGEPIIEKDSRNGNTRTYVTRILKLKQGTGSNPYSHLSAAELADKKRDLENSIKTEEAATTSETPGLRGETAAANLRTLKTELAKVTAKSPSDRPQPVPRERIKLVPAGVNRKAIHVDGNKVGELWGVRSRDSRGRVDANFGVTINGEKVAEGYSYFKDAVRDLPVILGEAGIRADPASDVSPKYKWSRKGGTGDLETMVDGVRLAIYHVKEDGANHWNLGIVDHTGRTEWHESGDTRAEVEAMIPDMVENEKKFQADREAKFWAASKANKGGAK